MTTIVGALLAIVALVGTNALDGGQLGALWQPAAALIVLGGTAGAVAIQFPASGLIQAFRDIVGLRQESGDAAREEVIGLLVAMAGHAHRKGVRVLGGVAQSLAERGEHPQLQRALRLVARGTPPEAIRDALYVELDHMERSGERSVRVLTSAGGYAPTMGILGAVLGLIQVMRNIEDPARLGSGIAVAFVATVYGLALANLFLLPLAGRLRESAGQRTQDLEVVIEGACAIGNGVDPRLVEYTLRSFSAKRTPDTPPRGRSQGATVST